MLRLCQRCHKRVAVGFFDSDGLWVQEVVEDEYLYCLHCAEFYMAMSGERLKAKAEEKSDG